MNELCRGCSSHIGNAKKCILQPKYKSHICPCSTCLVKSMCTEDYRSCSKYKKFCDIQLPNQTKPNEELPCRNCIIYSYCLEVVREVADELVIDIDIEDGNFIFEDSIVEDYMNPFFLKVMNRLRSSCCKLASYFEFQILPGDDITMPLNYRHQIITEDEWEERDSALYSIFNCNEMLLDVIPDHEGIIK